MIKGIDVQIMTQRAADYARDVNNQLQRDELGRDFSNRMHQLDTKHDLQSVNETEAAQHKRISEDNENGGNEYEDGQSQPKKKRGGALSPAEELASVGVGVEHRLLDIEV